ncbi:MAG: MFS transporter [Chloroflexi bacterium]|nr:MFS transporter [Chloroflexota bacterium]
MANPAAEHRDSAPIRRDPDQVEALRARGRFFYGWYIVACGWLFFLLGYGVLLYAPLILFDSWSEDFGWSRGILFGSYSFALLTVAVVSPFAGKLTDSHGARPVMFVGAIVLGAGTLGLRWMSEPWHLYLAFVISGVGFALAVVVPVNALIARWFERRRGIAMGITYTGVGAGGVVITPLVSIFISLVGWETTTTILALAILGLLIPLSLLVVRSDPYVMGLRPDGRPDQSTSILSDRAEGRPRHSAPLAGVSLAQAARTARFWIVGALFFVALGSSFGTFSQTLPFLNDLGYSSSIGTILISINGAVVIASKFFFGYLSDRVPAKTILMFATMGAVAAPLLMLSVSTWGAHRWLALGIPLILGTAATAFTILVPIVSASAFGLRHIGAISGALGSFAMLGMAAGPAVIGGLFVVTGSYTIPASIFTGCMVGVIVMLALGPSLGHRRVSGPPRRNLATAQHTDA